MDKTFTKSFEIRSFETDIHQKAKISALFGFFQEAASLHAEKLNVGYSDLEKGQQTFWALSRFTMKLNKYPVWKDTLEYETWPKGYNRLFGHRDFIISKNHDEIGKGSSDWIIIDQKTRTLVNPSSTVAHVPYEKDKHALTEGAKKIRCVIDDNAPITTREARYNDLDMNKHVNSIRYLDWALDCLPTDVLLNHYVKEFSVNYQHEVPAKEKVQVAFQKTKNELLTYQFSGKMQSNGKTAFVMELIFNKA